MPSEKQAVIIPATKAEVSKFICIKVADQKEKAPSAPPTKKRVNPKNQNELDLNIFFAASILKFVLPEVIFFEEG